jgi:sugar/nucleoside kinase (ribokinase family)
VILVSDQAETPAGGTITAAMREELANLDRLTWVDSRTRLELFRKVVLKGNREEIGGVLGRICGNLGAFLRHANSRLLMVTQGPEGALVVDRDGETHVPARPIKNPVDICGAGDSFSAGAAMALAIGASPVEAARFGNLVASVTIMKRGTGTASPQELLAASSLPTAPATSDP